MSITQQDIINELPTLVKPSDSDLLISLRSLVACGWGIECQLYGQLGDVWDAAHAKKQLMQCENWEIIGKLDRETLILSDFDCRKCYDTGTCLDDDYKDIPCDCESSS